MSHACLLQLRRQAERELTVVAGATSSPWPTVSYLVVIAPLCLQTRRLRLH